MKAAKKSSAGVDGVKALLAQKKGDWIRRILSDREIQLMRPVKLPQPLKKSVESERVADGGGDSRGLRQSGFSGVPSAAAQGAAAECQGSLAAVRGHSVAITQQLPKAQANRSEQCGAAVILVMYAMVVVQGFVRLCPGQSQAEWLQLDRIQVQVHQQAQVQVS